MPEDIYAGERAMLASLVASEKVPHAYIIEGDECAEKKSLAFFLAASLLCTGDRPPCGKCPSCIKAASGNGSGHPDIHFFEPEKDKTLSVDTVRSIKKDRISASQRGKAKGIHPVFGTAHEQVRAERASQALRGAAGVRSVHHMLRHAQLAAAHRDFERIPDFSPFARRPDALPSA